MTAGSVSKRDFSSRVGVVLYRPKSPGNVGSVARAMKNMGFNRLIIAEPMDYKDPGHFDTESRRLAWNAVDLLARRVETETLPEALQPFTYVIGTSSNPSPAARVLTPKEAALETSALIESDASNIALLFGQEDIGLTRDAQARCHAVVRIPASDDYASLNLAQAALVCLYEMRMVFAGLTPSGKTASGPLPSQKNLDAFYERLEQALEAIDFFQGTGRDHMMRELRLIFNRAVMTERELAIFEGITHRIQWLSTRFGQEPPAR